MRKIAVLISGGGSNLQALIDACAAGEIAGELSLVLSNRPGAAGLQRASAAGIEGAVIDHRDYASREAFDAELVAALARCNPDLVILAGFMRILTPRFIGPYRGRLLNIHPSLLPHYPGLNTHQRALDAGDRWTGATVHFVTEELDGGPPIVFARVPITAGDTAKPLRYYANPLAPAYAVYRTAKRSLRDPPRELVRIGTDAATPAGDWPWVWRARRWTADCYRRRASTPTTISRAKKPPHSSHGLLRGYLSWPRARAALST